MERLRTLYKFTQESRQVYMRIISICSPGSMVCLSVTLATLGSSSLVDIGRAGGIGPRKGGRCPWTSAPFCYGGLWR